MRQRPFTSSSLIAMTATVAITIAACSSGDDDVVASPTSTEVQASTTTSAASTTSAAPTTTAAPATTAAPTTSAAPTTTAVPTTTVAPVVDAIDIGEVGGFEDDPPIVLSPGQYTVSILEPYAFDIDEEVQIHFALSDLVLVRDPMWPLEERAASVHFLELNGLVPPELAADESVRNVNGPAQLDRVLPTPVDLTAWIEAVPNVSIGDQGVIEAPGTTVRWWDVVLDADAGPTFRCAADTDDCVGSFVGSPEITGVYPLEAQNLQRFYLFDALPGVVGVVDGRDAAFVDRGIEIMEMIVGGLRPTA